MTAGQMARMERTANEFAAAIKGVSDAALSKRPDDKSWSAKETLCHVRDTEESFMQRFQVIMEMDEPHFLPADPDRCSAQMSRMLAKLHWWAIALRTARRISPYSTAA